MIDQWHTLLEAHRAIKDPARTALPAHEPTTVVLACSDARVPPSVIFDQPAGNLFVVRVAGNTATPAALASIDYAVAELGVELVVVLGHTNCGAVNAACSGRSMPHLAPVTAAIRSLIDDDGCADPERLAKRHVEATLAELASTDTPTGHAIRRGAVTLTGAIYDLVADDIIPVASPLALHTNSMTTTRSTPA